MQYWKKVNAGGETLTVESCSNPHNVPDGIKIGKKEFNAFLASLPTPEPIVPRDLAAEIDELKAEIEKLK